MAESDGERVDRELIELLNELRVALPGVQVLFAFLLTVPFAPRFATLSPAERRVYFASVLVTAASSALLIAPTAHHRLLFRRHSKERLLKAANALALAGTFLLAVAVGLAVWVVSSVTYDDRTAGTAAGLVAGGTVALWFALPLALGRDGRAVPQPRSAGTPGSGDGSAPAPGGPEAVASAEAAAKRSSASANA